MGDAKIYHNVYKVFAAEEVATTSSATSDWLDVSGWTDKVVAFEVDDSGTVDVNVTLHVSSQDAYELNNKTVTTDDYSAVSIVNAHTGKVYIRYDGEDVDDLQRPVRALRVFFENDEASTASTVNLWVEGWS